MTDKIWPIKSDTSCLLKWGWSTLWLNSATASSCHRCRPDAITLENFDTFHNTPEKIQDRQKMLRGEWPGDGSGCEYCRDVEALGGVSDRQSQLSQLRDPGLVASELFQDPTATHVDPTILEVYFRNTCNMKCVYCQEIFSSQIEFENRMHGNARKKFGWIDLAQDLDKRDNITAMTQKLWEYLRDNDRYRKLRRYHILGGEPFLLQELDESIDFFEQNPNPDLVFSVITNLNIPPKVIGKYIDRFERLVDNGCIWRLQITGSLDAWMPEQEYVRSGLDLDKWEENFTMFARMPWSNMSINSVFSALTLHGLPSLIDKIKEWNELIPHDEKIVFSGNIDREITNPIWFGPGIFEDCIDQSVEKLSGFRDPHAQEVASNLIGFKKQIMSATPRRDMIKRMQDYLTEIDSRRNTDWRKTFGWLDKEF